MSKTTMLRGANLKLATGVLRMLTVPVSTARRWDLVDTTRNAKRKTLLTLYLILSLRREDPTGEIQHLKTKMGKIHPQIMKRQKRHSRIPSIYARWLSCGYEPHPSDNH